MSTAGRPTFTPALGGDTSRVGQGGVRVHAPSKQFSAKDLKSHTKLKERKAGQNTKDEISKRDLKRELERKEKKHFQKTDNITDDQTDSESDQDEKEKVKLLQEKQTKTETKQKKENIDADDSESESSSDSDKQSESESEKEDDDTAELLKELEKIKREREEEAMKKEREEHARSNHDKDEQILRSNPLLNQQSSTTDFNIKKRWYDDTVFKHQSRGEVKQQKRFVNDTIRNDFHRKFLQKFVQ